MIPKILLLVEQIRPRTAQVDNLRTPIPILLQSRALEAVERVRDALIPMAPSASLFPFPPSMQGNGEEGKLTSPPHTTHLFW